MEIALETKSLLIGLYLGVCFGGLIVNAIWHSMTKRTIDAFKEE